MAEQKKRGALEFLLEINEDLFRNILATYLILLLIDTIWGKSVSSYLNLGNLLIAAIACGAIMGLAQEKTKNGGKASLEITEKEYGLISIFGIIGSLVVYHKTALTGNLSILISVFSGLMMILLPILIIRDREKW